MGNPASSTPSTALVACMFFMLSACSGGGGSSPSPSPPPADTTPPDTTLAGAPPALTNTITAAFTFTATEAGSTFETRLDGATFAAATSPVNLSGLGEGSHTFEVRARDAAGNVDASPASATWVVDTSAPDTAVVSAPAAATASSLATFTFSSPDPTASFEVSVDNAPFVVAASPYSLTVTDGAHNFRVRARDGAGNIDATPASAAWLADTTAPDTAITSAPTPNLPVPIASFSFSSPDASATFEVSVDGGAFVGATSPYVIRSIAEGAHNLQVRARDAVGNVDSTPASAPFVVVDDDPVGRIVFPPPLSYTDGTTLTVRGTATDSHGIRDVRVNGVAATSADGFATWSAQIPIAVSGANTIVLAVTDAGGNETASADTAVVHNRGPNILLVQGLAFDPTGDQLLIVDRRTSNLYAFDAGDRLGRIIANLDEMTFLRDEPFNGSIAVDAANNRAIFADGAVDHVSSVNLATGAIRQISGSHPGSTMRIGLSAQLALDPANNRAFVTTDGQTVLSVNLTTGTRTIVTSDTVGTGIALDLPAGIAYDNQTTPGTPRLLISDINFSSNRIIAVDVATGARSEFSSSGHAGSGPSLVSPSSLQLDPANNRLLVMDIGAHALVAVNLANGNRSYLAAPGVGTGTPMYADAGVALSPSGRIYTGNRGGEVLELDPATLARNIFVGTPLGTGPRIRDGRALVLESPESLLYLDYALESVLRVDLRTGNRSVVSSFDASVGSGPRLMYAADMVLDRRAPSPGSRVFVTTGFPTNALLSVDLATGDRSPVADLGQVLPSAQAGSMALDAERNRMLFIENVPMSAGADSIFAVDLASGIRSTISSNVVGTGPEFALLMDLVLFPAANPYYAFVSNIVGGGDPNLSNILAVDLPTSNRITFRPSTGTLPIRTPAWMHFDAQNNRILAINSDPEMLSVMPVNASLRTLVSGVHTGTGAMRGTGMKAFGSAIEYNAVDDIAYTIGLEGSLLAIDMVSGDRVQVSH